MATIFTSDLNLDAATPACGCWLAVSKSKEPLIQAVVLGSNAWTGVKLLFNLLLSKLN